MTIIPSSLPSLVVALSLLATKTTADVDSGRRDVVLPAVQECDPNKAEFRMAARTSTGPCAWGSHCVLNGRSSLGGYCIDNDNKSVFMDMPETLKEFCYVCDSPHEITSGKNEVTKEDDKVGSFTCGELDDLGRAGNIPKTNCQMFQQMIEANNLCGCSSIYPEEEEDEDLDQAEDVTPTDDAYVYIHHTKNWIRKSDTPGSDASDETSSGSMKSVSMAVTVAASAVIAVMLNFW